MPGSEDADPDLDLRIRLLDGPCGGDPDVRERERAAEWLVARADRAYPALIARLDAGEAGAGAVALLAHFGRSESIATLARLLTGPESIAWQAGQALARHPQPAAGEALRAALAHSSPAVAIVAADGLGTRGDGRDCAALTQRLADADAGVRFHALQAVGQIGCLSLDVIDRLARTDADADVRALAGRLLVQPRPPG